MRKFKDKVRLVVLSAVVLSGALGFSTVDLSGPAAGSGQVLAIDWPIPGETPVIDWP